MIEAADTIEYALPTLVVKCAKCKEHWLANYWTLIGAFASVGIEHGKSTWEMAEDYFDSYHRNGHRG